MRSLLIAGALLACAALAGCYDTPRPDCAFLCAEGDVCPEGYFCAGDGWCKRDGVAEDFMCTLPIPDAAVADASAPDAGDAAAGDAAPGDAAPDATPGTPDATPTPDAVPPPDAPDVTVDAMPDAMVDAMDGGAAP